MPSSFPPARLLLLAAAAAALAWAPPAHAASGGALAGEAPSHGATGGLAAESSAAEPATAASSGGAAPTQPLAAPVAPAAPVAEVPAFATGGPIVAADVPFGPLIATTARRYGLSSALLTALVWQESGFRARARSKAGARGLTQLMPGTARDLGVRRVYDPAQNVDGGARYLRAMLIRFGSAELALAAYNAGPARVIKHRGVPPIAETRRYVGNVLALAARLHAAGVR